MTDRPPPRFSHPLLRKLNSMVQLQPADEQALLGLIRPPRVSEPRTDLVSVGQVPTAGIVIVSGWACRIKHLENGKRQIVALLLPGDFTEPFGALPDIMDHTISSLGAVGFSNIEVPELRRLASSNERLEEALWADLLVTQSTQYELHSSLGRRSAAERLGHLFCELYHRLHVTGHIKDDGYQMPMSQTDLADLLGLSTVHVNRSLQELRSSGMLSVSDKRVTIHDLDGLQNASYFDPSYIRFQRFAENKENKRVTS
jgi:CRP-like cAMP-binding protein